MFLDNSLTFNSAVGTGQAVSATADSTSIVDVTGAGSGNLPTIINGFPATNTAVGSDYGAGDGQAIPHVYITVSTAGTGSGTVTITVNAAPDNGSGSPGTYTQLASTKALVGTSLVAGAIIDIPLPPTLWTLSEALPRFYKLTYTVSGTFTATFQANLALSPYQGSIGGTFYNNNFIVV